MTMATRMAVMHEGRVAQVGTPAEIYEAPGSRFVADFIGNVNLLDGRVATADALQLSIDSPDVHHLVARGAPISAGSKVTVALRPEKIQIGLQAPADPSVNAVKAVVREKAYCGSFTMYHLALPSGAMLKVASPRAHGPLAEDPTFGQEVWAHWPASAAVVLTQ